MAKKKGPQKIEVVEFDDLHRGTSYTIPVLINKADGTPLDVSNYIVYFTLKASQSDFDYDDDRAIISKWFTPAKHPDYVNRFDIVLTSKDLWIEPGQYFFDIVLMHEYSSQRIMLASTNIVGGPSNRIVRHEENQGNFFLKDPIVINGDDGKKIQINLPLVADPPKNLIETAHGDPHYIFQPVDDPIRNILYRVYGPRISLMMTFQIAHDHTPHRVRFDEFFLRGNIPAPCPLKDGLIEFNNRGVTLKLAKQMDMVWKNTVIQHNPEITYDGGCGSQKSDEPLWMGDRTDAGHLYIHLNDVND